MGNEIAVRANSTEMVALPLAADGRPVKVGDTLVWDDGESDMMSVGTLKYSGDGWWEAEDWYTDAESDNLEAARHLTWSFDEVMLELDEQMCRKEPDMQVVSTLVHYLKTKEW